MAPLRGLLRSSIALCSAAACLCAAACSEPEPEWPDQFGYATSAQFLTVNAGSELGATTGADAIASRLFPGVFVHGPEGQFIPSRDFATASVVDVPGVAGPAPFYSGEGSVPDAPAGSVIDYVIAQGARYSDDVEVTCDDFLLAFTAGVMKETFHSAVPLMHQVDHVDCAPGAKQFRLFFKPGLGSRWRELFSPGTVMPSHVVAQAVGWDSQQLVDALDRRDPDELASVAEAYGAAFRLDAPEGVSIPSSGPFMIESRTPEGALILVRNEAYPGDPAELDKIYMWPAGADVAELAANNDLEIADLVGSGFPAWVDRDDPKNRFDVQSVEGDLNEVLALGNAGVFASNAARRAFASCVDPVAVAAASSKVAGVEVAPMGLRLTTADDPINDNLSDIAQAHITADVAGAEVLRDATVRIGYVGPDPRKAAMVQAIAASCAQAGVTVVDVSDQASYPSDVIRTSDASDYGFGAAQSEDPAAQWSQSWSVSEVIDGAADALLVAIDPYYSYPTSNATVSDVESLRAEEQRLWATVPTVPLSVQPRTLVFDRRVANVVAHTALAGIGWNMDRWAQAQEGEKK